jgi:hypothetical protein
MLLASFSTRSIVMTDLGINAVARQAKMRRSASLWVLSFTLLLLAVTVVLPSAGHAESERNTQTAQAPNYDDQLSQYRGFRRMHARNDKFNHESWLDAWTEFDERGFRYEVVSERGSDYMLNKVLKPLLKREQEIVAEGGPSRAALTEENYEFTEPERVDGVQYVVMKPRRKDIVLVDGRMVLSSDGSDVVRIEGKLAKNPSFWTSLVNVIRHFARVDGVRVPVSTETIAKVKFAGQSRLDVTYEYESINYRRVSLAARQTIASARGAQ